MKQHGRYYDEILMVLDLMGDSVQQAAPRRRADAALYEEPVAPTAG
jgi:hypothetical protein